MHELSVAQSIVDLLDKYIPLHKARHVRSVRIQIGEAHCIIVDSLVFCFEMVTQDDPILAGAKLDVEILPHRALCHNCSKEFLVIGLVVQCPLCLDWNARVISGTEFRVLSMEIDADSPVPEVPVASPSAEAEVVPSLPTMPKGGRSAQCNDCAEYSGC